MPKLKTTFLLFTATVLTRLPFTSRLLYNMDSVQFALGANSFDVSLHQPHPPGYFLYVMIGRLLMWFTHDANTAFVAVSVLSSACAVVMVYYTGREIFGESTGIASAAVALTSPLFWFHGEVALSYAPEAFMSVLTAYLCIRILKGEARLFWLAALVLGIAGGIRQNTMVFLMPLWLYSMKGVGMRKVLGGLAIFTATVLLWFVPMVELSGGYARYTEAAEAHWQNAGWRGISLRQTAYHARDMLFFLLSGLCVALVPVLSETYALIRKPKKTTDIATATFFSLWILPAFLFHLVVLTHPAVPGHSLIYLVGLFVIAGKCVVTACGRLAGMLPRLNAPRVLTAGLLVLFALNALYFFVKPYPFTCREIRYHDNLLSAYINAVRGNFSPADTEVIGTERFVMNFRHAMYYLPEFRVYDNAATLTRQGRLHFWGEGGKTYLAENISFRPATRHVVIFLKYGPDGDPVPEGAKYLDAGDGMLLAYYDDPAWLYGPGRIAGLTEGGRK